MTPQNFVLLTPFVAGVAAFAFLIVNGYPLAGMTALVAGLFVEILSAYGRRYG